MYFYANLKEAAPLLLAYFSIGQEQNDVVQKAKSS
jgi:hypothetical protein